MQLLLAQELFGGFAVYEEIGDSVVVCGYCQDAEELLVFCLVEASSQGDFLEADHPLLLLLEFAVLREDQSQLPRQVDGSDEVGRFPDEERGFEVAELRIFDHPFRSVDV